MTTYAIYGVSRFTGRRDYIGTADDHDTARALIDRWLQAYDTVFMSADTLTDAGSWESSETMWEQPCTLPLS